MSPRTVILLVTMSQEVRCLTENEVLDYLAGLSNRKHAGHIQDHLRDCGDCTRVVAELARDVGSVGTILSSGLRPLVLLPGSIVAGRYLIRRALGVGAMGEVHEAVDQLLGKTVALKTLNARLVGDERALRRLKAEVASAHRVTHPNVCRTFDLGINPGVDSDGMGGALFLTMEYLEGETLGAYLRKRGQLAPEEARGLLVQIAAGLGAAHAVGVVHRDLKSDNVMLVPQSQQSLRAVITDFGLAGSVATNEPGSRDSRHFSGTLAYAAPERLAGHGATPASDVYALGLIALEMLTGRLAKAPLPPEWEPLIARMTYPLAAMRFPDGQAAMAALKQATTLLRKTPSRWWGSPSAWLGATALAMAVAMAIVAVPARPRAALPASSYHSGVVVAPAPIPETPPRWRAWSSRSRRHRLPRNRRFAARALARRSGCKADYGSIAHRRWPRARRSRPASNPTRRRSWNHQTTLSATSLAPSRRLRRSRRRQLSWSIRSPVGDRKRLGSEP